MMKMNTVLLSLIYNVFGMCAQKKQQTSKDTTTSLGLTTDQTFRH